MAPARYQALEQLGQGAQGAVSLARDRATGATVVLKRGEGAARAALRREYALLAELGHPNVVRALDLIDEAGATVLVQTHAPGPDFATWTRRHEGDARRLGLAAGAALRGLELIHHRGLVHRDIKPHNLRVADEPIGRLPGVRIIDFGLASATADAGLVGTLGYAAPEVLAGGVASAAADIYGLGAVLFEALFERLPNPQLDPSAQTIDVPPLEGRQGLASGGLLRELLSDMLHPVPGLRPSAAAALATLGEAVGEPLQVSADELAGPYFPRPRLVGRDQELAALEALIGEAIAGGGRAVILDGCGKTALVRAAARRARLRGVVVLGAEALAGELAAAAAELAGASVEQLVTRVVDRCIERARRAPLLLTLDGLDAGQAPVGPLLHQLLRALESELRRCLLLWSGPLPAAADRAGFELIEQRLEPLDEEAAAAMVTGMLYHLEPPGWLPELLRLARGDPRWIAELVRVQIEARLPRTLVAPGSEPRRAVGDDPDAAIASRLDALDDGERRTLALISRAPDALPLAVLRRAASPGCDAAVAALCQRELLTQGATGVRLSSVALQRALRRRRLVDAEPPALHASLAQAWDEAGAEDPRRDDQRAFHLLRAGDAATAAPLLLRAASVGDEDLARALGELASEDPHAPALRARLARRLRARGELERALAIADEAGDRLLRAELLLDAGQPAAASAALVAVLTGGAPPSAAHQRLVARARFLQGDYLGAAAAAQEGRRRLTAGLAADEEPSLAVELGVLEGLAAVYRGEVAAGLATLRAAEAPATELDAPLLLARLHNSIGIALQRLGRLDEAEPAFARCLTQARRSGDLRVAATAALNLGTIAHRRGRWAQALERYGQAGALAARAGIGTTRISALANEANLLLVFGELARAEQRLTQAETLGEAAGAPALRGHVAIYRAELELLRGNVEVAERHVARAAELLPAEDRAGRDAADLCRGELALAQQRPGRALSVARELLARMAADDPDRWRAHLLAGKALLADGAADAADDAPADVAPAPAENAAVELERALAAALAGRSIERRWEGHALLARCYAESDPEAAAFHAARFERALAALRDRVPAAHRAAFDARDDLRRTARGLPREAAGATTGPSRQDLLRLLELNKELNRRLPLDDLLLRVLDRAIALTGAERGFVLLEGAGGLRVAASRNVDREAVRRGVDKFSRSIAERALAEQRPVLAADAMDDARFAQRLSVHGLKLRAVLCVPLSAGGTRGALYLDNRFRRDAFSAGHVAMVQAFADQAAIALYNASLLRDEASQRAALERTRAELEAANHQLRSQVTRQSQQLSEISGRLRAQEEELVRRYNAAKIIGRSKAMRRLYAQLDRVAESDLPVVLYGESGTGKELVARALHYIGPRAGAPFVAVNCGAVPGSLIESELFGHARGAFTGALHERAGLFEVAGEGTLLLDEVGDMPPEMQVKLLRVLQEGRYRRVGEERERRARCRVLAASHRQLAELVQRGALREDLYYRLNVVTLEVPPLRERREDIPALVQHFLEASGRAPPVTPAALAALIDHDWPGNVRELENELQRAALLAGEGIGLDDLSPALRAARRRPARGASAAEEGLQDALERYERRLIAHALDRSGFNVSQAARELRVHRVALHRKIRKHGLGRAGLR